MIPARPMTETEATATVRNTQAAIDEGGLWLKICIHCGRNVGARVAKYGKPTAADLKHSVCPFCPHERDGYDGSEHIRLEFQPPG